MPNTPKNQKKSHSPLYLVVKDHPPIRTVTAPGAHPDTLLPPVAPVLVNRATPHRAPWYALRTLSKSLVIPEVIDPGRLSTRDP